MIHRIPSQYDPKWTPPEEPFAFPWQGVGYFDTGMTLRDWFAGQALPAVIRQCVGDGFTDGTIEDLFARRSYLVADALIAARTQEKG